MYLLTTMLFQVNVLKDTTATHSIWPETVGGWVLLASALLGLVGTLYGYAKGLAILNGLGGRVDKLTERLDKKDGKDAERDLLWATMVSTMHELQKAVAEAKMTSQQCDSNTEKYFIEIGSKVDELRRAVDTQDRNTHGRLVGIETELRLRNEARPLFIQKE